MKFKNSAEYLVKTRERARVSQLMLSQALGFSVGQFISNCERGISSIPPRHFILFAKITRSDVKNIREAYIQDIIANIDREIDNAIY